MSDPTPAVTTAQAEAKGTARALGLVSIAILCSRLLGLVREIIISSLFADKANLRWLDCFNMAFRAPNMLRDLFAEGALSTAFVTVFAKKAAKEGDEAAWSLARKIASLTTVWMTLVSALGVLLSPWIIWLMASGWRNPSDPKNVLSAEDLQAKLDFTITLTRIMFPFILLVSLAALVMGMLNARKVFFMPAMASTFFNVASMLVGGLVGWWMDPAFGKTAIIGFAVGVLVGGLAQLGAQLPSLKKVGFRFGLDFRWKDPGVKQTLDLMWPAVISGSVVQINVLLNANFASYVAGDGPVTWLNNAFRLMQLPLGLFGVGLATVSLPSLARMAANGITQDFRDTLSKALRVGALLSMPSAVGLIMLAYPIMSLLYGNGRAATNPAHVPGCAVALQTYAIGLVFYSGLKVLQPAFYAIDKRFIPMVVSLICVLFTAVSNYVFVVHWHLDHRYLALSTSLSAALNFGCLFFAMRHHAGRFGGRKLVLTFAKVGIAALCMAGACWLAQQTLLSHWNDPVQAGQSRVAWVTVRALLLGVTIAISAGVYFVVSALLKNEELGDFTGSLKRKLGKGRKPA